MSLNWSRSTSSSNSHPEISLSLLLPPPTRVFHWQVASLPQTFSISCTSICTFVLQVGGSPEVKRPKQQWSVIIYNIDMNSF